MLALLLPNATEKPAPDAAWLMVTEHEVFPGVLIVALEQVMPVSWVATVRLSVAVLLTPA